MVPKYSIGDRVFIPPDRVTGYTILDRKENKYGYWLYDLSSDEGKVQNVSENAIEAV